MSNWRKNYPILVPNAHAVAMVGVIRSLGRAGYPVHAIDPNAEAIGLFSKFASKAVQSPPYGHAGFIPWLRDYVARNEIRGIAPAGVLLPMREHYEEFQPLVPISPDAGLVYRGLSKYETSELLLSPKKDLKASLHLPPTLLLEHGDLPSPKEFAQLGLPAFIKTDQLHSTTGAGAQVIPIHNAEDGPRTLDRLWRDYGRVSVQGYVPGLGAAAAFVIWHGRTYAEFMNLCLHESPHTGGLCSLRESWHHPSMLEDARIKIADLEWEGASMLEYRWEQASDRFWLIELNPRFWAALHTALYADLDMPRILFDVFFGRLDDAAADYRIGVRARLTFPFEMGYVISRFRDRNVPLPSRLGSVMEFFALFFDWRIRSDFFYPGDRALYFRQLRGMLQADLKRWRRGGGH